MAVPAAAAVSVSRAWAAGAPPARLALRRERRLRGSAPAPPAPPAPRAPRPPAPRAPRTEVGTLGRGAARQRPRDGRRTRAPSAGVRPPAQELPVSKNLGPGCGAGTRLGSRGLARDPQGGQGAAPPWRSAPFAVTLRVCPGWVAPASASARLGVPGAPGAGVGGGGRGAGWEPPQLLFAHRDVSQPVSLRIHAARHGVELSAWRISERAHRVGRVWGAAMCQRLRCRCPGSSAGCQLGRGRHCGSAALGAGPGCWPLCIATPVSRALWGGCWPVSG